MTDIFTRKIHRDPDEWWDYLTEAQKISANALFQYGYRLAFIRDVDTSQYAVLTLDEKIIALKSDGEIEYQPNIVLREKAIKKDC